MSKKLDEVLSAAVSVAHQSVCEVADPNLVGEHVAVKPERTRVVSHYFASNVPGYPGWQWVSTVTRAPRSKEVTVIETAFLPGPQAWVPPAWQTNDAALAKIRGR